MKYFTNIIRNIYNMSIQNLKDFLWNTEKY